MLFRKKDDGMLIEINRMDYKNDEIYYKKIFYAKTYNGKQKENDENNCSYTKKIIICFLEDAFYNSDEQYKNEE
jgi:hypothetical protein